MSDWKLLIEDDVGHTTSVPVQRDLITIGREEGNTVRLTERNVSRRHARLSREDNQLFIEDLGSYNGIRINGDRIQGRVELCEGDLIEIGDYHLALEAAVEHESADGTTESATLSGLLAERTDDAFAGATQRWEASPSQMPTEDGGLPLEKEWPETAETIRMPAAPGPEAIDDTTESGVPEDLDAYGAGLSGLRSLAAMEAADYAAADLGESWLPPARPGPQSERPLASALTDQRLEAKTEPYFPAYRGSNARPEPNPGHKEPIASMMLARVSLVDEPESASALPDVAHQQTVPNLPAVFPAPSASPAPTETTFPAADDGPPAPGSAGETDPHDDEIAATDDGAPVELASQTEPLSSTATPDSVALPGDETEQIESISEVDTRLPRLVALNTVLAGASFPIDGLDMEVGRVEGCDLLIQHKSVSRSHCRLVREDGRVRVIDLKSANGTLVNGVELEQAVLRSGDVLELGTVLLRFVTENDDFHLTDEEILRAREAEARGAEWQDDSTLTSLPFGRNPKQKSSVGKLMAATAVLLVVAVLAFVVGRISDRPAELSTPAADAHSGHGSPPAE